MEHVSPLRLLSKSLYEKGILFDEDCETGEEVFSQLIEEGLLEYPDSVVENFLELLKGIKEPVRFGTLFQEFADKGLLRNVSIVKGEEGNPVFQFRHGRFLGSFAEGYRFGVSPDRLGRADYGSSQTTLQGDYLVSGEFEENIRPLIILSHIAEATNEYVEFWETVTGNKEVFNNFIEQYSKFEELSVINFDIEKSLGLVESGDLLPEGLILKRISLQESSRKFEEESVFGSLIVSRTFVALKQYNSGKWKFINFMEYDNTKNKVSEYVYYLVMWTRLAILLLSLERVRENYLTLSPFKNENAIFVNKNSVLSTDNPEEGNIFWGSTIADTGDDVVGILESTARKFLSVGQPLKISYEF